MSLNPTLIASRLLTRPSALLVVSIIGICRTPTVTGKMANFVAFVAFRSTWTSRNVSSMYCPMSDYDYSKFMKPMHYVPIVGVPSKNTRAVMKTICTHRSGGDTIEVRVASVVDRGEVVGAGGGGGVGCGGGSGDGWPESGRRGAGKWERKGWGLGYAAPGKKENGESKGWGLGLFLCPHGGIYGEVGVNTFRNAIGAHYLPHYREYVAPPSIDIVRPWFETIGYGETILVKGILKKSLPPNLANGINIDYPSIFWEDIIIKLNKRHREKVVPYTRFLSLLMMHKIKEGYRDGEVTPYPTQVFSVNNWALKPNQPEEPLFTNHMLAICNAAEPVVFKAPKPSSNAERVPQGTNPGAKPGHKKHLTSLKQPSVSSKETTKGGSSKAPTGSKTGHLKRKKESSLAMDSNPSQTSASIPVVAEMHKEDQQATSGPTSLGVTSEARANPQLSSGMSAFNLNEPIYSASFIIYSESASGDDASTVSTAEVDPGISAPSTDPHVLADKTQSVSEGLETVLTQPITRKWASSIARQVKEDEASRTINDEDEEADKVHATTNVETEDTSVPKSSSPRSSQIQELTNQVHILQSQKHKLELEKNKAEAEVALLKAQPSFPNILSAHDFSSSLPTELKDLPSKFNELTKEGKGLKKQVHELDIKLPGYLKEIPSKLEDFTKTITSLTSQVAELKTL
ncbi:hypothetical protein Tco_1394784 [Tanacetum coccineum]